MTTFIELGGQQRPVRFGYAGLYNYEVTTGRNALADFAKMQDGFQSVSVVHLVDLVYSGLLSGYKSEKRNVDFEKEDIVEWLDSDTILEVMKAFAASFPEGNAKAGPRKKATVPAE